jgi:hypothetical protein
MLGITGGGAIPRWPCRAVVAERGSAFSAVPHPFTHRRPALPGEYGEVFSPTGQRAYLAAQAAELAGRTPRWATELARAGNVVDSERGHIAGRQGGQAWFLIADSFEQHLETLGLWPPRPVGGTSEWQQRFELQGADLEAARREIAELQQRNAELVAVNERLQVDRNSLLDTIATLTQIAKTTPPPGPGRHE